MKKLNTKQEAVKPFDPPDSPKARAKRLRRLRTLGDLKRKELCEQSNINIHTLIGWENGRFGGISISGAKRIIHFLNRIGVECSLDWLLYEIGPGPVSGISRAQFSPQYDVTDIKNADSDNINNELLYFKNRHPEAADFIVNDDSMLPIYQPGDYVAGIKQYGKNIASIIGQHCIVQTAKGNLFFRQVRQGTQENMYTLICLNSEFQQENAIIADIKLANAAPIIWHRKPLTNTTRTI